MADIFDKLSSTSKKLMFREPFYGLYLISLNKDISERIATACVSKNGINVQLTVNPKFWDTQDDITQIGILKHELLHIAMGHLDMYERFPDKELANMAMDLEINQYVGDSFKGKTWDGLELKRYPELKLPEKAGSKVYYDALDKINKKRQQQQGQGQPQQGQGDGQQGQGQSQQGQGQGQSQQGQGQSKNDGSSPEKSKIWDTYDHMKSGNDSLYAHKLWKEFYEGLSEAEKKLIKKQVEHQLKTLAEEVQKSRGTIPGELRGIIDNLFAIEEPVIDWKSYLRRFASHSNKIYTKKSRRKLNKRFASNPALKIKQRKTILVARDTSGSVSKADYEEYFSELHHMWKSGVRIMILDADADVQDIFEYKGKAPDHISGGGGTYFEPAIDYYNEHWKQFDCMIYLTDGQCSAPTNKPRGGHMLWVITSGGTMSYAEGYPGKKVQISR